MKTSKKLMITIALCIWIFFFYQKISFCGRIGSTYPNHLISELDKKQSTQNTNHKPTYKEQPSEHKTVSTLQLSVPQLVQENNYYCVPAALQMVLKYKGIEISQAQLANEMNTVPITGTEYADLARVANTYLFDNDHVEPNEPGYHVQILNRYDNSPQIMAEFIRRVKIDIQNDDPVFVSIDLHALYPELSSAVHVVVLTGYDINTEQDDILDFYYIDPYYGVQDTQLGGLKKVPKDVFLNAMTTNKEPAYVW